MPRAWIAEFTTPRVEAQAAFAKLPVLVHQPVINIASSGSTPSAAFNAETNFIRVVCEVQCTVSMDTDASTSALLMPALHPEYFGVKGGSYLSITLMP